VQGIEPDECHGIDGQDPGHDPQGEALRAPEPRNGNREKRGLVDRLHGQDDAIVAGIGAAVEPVGMHADGVHRAQPYVFGLRTAS
jgi:hypothetical protein